MKSYANDPDSTATTHQCLKYNNLSVTKADILSKLFPSCRGRLENVKLVDYSLPKTVNKQLPRKKLESIALKASFFVTAEQKNYYPKCDHDLEVVNTGEAPIIRKRKVIGKQPVIDRKTLKQLEIFTKKPQQTPNEKSVASGNASIRSYFQSGSSNSQKAVKSELEISNDDFIVGSILPQSTTSQGFDDADLPTALETFNHTWTGDSSLRSPTPTQEMLNDHFLNDTAVAFHTPIHQSITTTAIEAFDATYFNVQQPMNLASTSVLVDERKQYRRSKDPINETKPEAQNLFSKVRKAKSPKKLALKAQVSDSFADILAAYTLDKDGFEIDNGLLQNKSEDESNNIFPDVEEVLGTYSLEER